MSAQKVIVLGYISIIEICDTKIEKNIKEKCKIEYRKIEAIFARSSYILNSTIDAENPERLNQEIKKQKKSKIGYKFTLHL